MTYYTIAVIGDVHARTAWTVKAIEYAAAEGAQEIIQVGDFAFWFDDSFIDAVSDVLDRTGLQLKFVEGNHDNPEVYNNLRIDDDGFGVLRHNIRRIPRGHTWALTDEVTAMGFGGAVSVDRDGRTPHVTWWPGESIRYSEVMQTIYAGKRADIMFTHDAPSGVNIPGINKDNDKYWPADAVRDSNHNRYLLRQVVDSVRPTMLFCGHYHVRHTDILVGDDYETTINIINRDNTYLAENVQIVHLPGKKG